MEELILGKNKIDDNGVGYLCEANWKQITLIDLSKNSQFKHAGIEKMANAGWTKLTRLVLSGCLIGNKGAKTIAESDWHLLK